jgi:pyrroline-5-carboxylate reductase
MNRIKKILVVGSVVAALGAGSVAVAGAVSSSDDGEKQATGPAADKARQAALAITGGTANSVEQDGENGATWEVEVTKPDGQTVDVRLDDQYDLVVIEGDSEQPDSAD